MSTIREHDTRRTTARRGLGAATVVTALLLPVAAATAETSSGQPNKAQVEHAERLAATPVTKAQVEHAERQATSSRSSTAPEQRTSPISAPSSSDAAAWELAASAAVGALLTATVMGGARRFAHRERALAH